VQGQCGVFVFVSEAARGAGRLYCSLVLLPVQVVVVLLNKQPSDQCAAQGDRHCGVLGCSVLACFWIFAFGFRLILARKRVKFKSSKLYDVVAMKLRDRSRNSTDFKTENS
jgi:hypothetical protein